MIKMLKFSFIWGITIFFALPVFALDTNCSKGISSSWSFDQKKNRITLTGAFPTEVCHHIKKQLNSNIQINLLKKKKVIFSNKIFWRNTTIHEVVKNKNLIATGTQSIQHKNLKFPISLSKINRYEVIDLVTKKIIGEGEIK